MIGMYLRVGLAFVLAIIAFASGGTGAGIFFMICGVFFAFYTFLMKSKEGGAAGYTPEPNKPRVPANRFVCKNCGKIRTGWYQVCPDCGASGTMEKLRQPVTLEPVTRQPDACIHN